MVQSPRPHVRRLDKDQGELIDYMLDHEDLATTPGATHDYLNFGYCLLGRVIEQVTGLNYAEAVRQHVLLPDDHPAGRSSRTRINVSGGTVHSESSVEK